MSLDPKDVFNLMECAYRNGVLEKFMAIQGEVLEAVMERANVNMGDLCNRLDDAEEGTVQKVDRLLMRLGPLLKYANSDRLMRTVSRLLDLSAVRGMLVANMRNAILKTLPGQAPPSLRQRIKAVAGKAA